MTSAAAVRTTSHADEPRVRLRYIEAARTTASLADDGHRMALVEHMVAAIEFYSVVALTGEIKHELGVVTAADVMRRLEEIEQRLEALSHVDLARFLTSAERILGTEAIDDPVPREPAPWDQALREYAAIVAEYPIEDVEASAYELGAADHAHRARTSHDALRALLRRNDPAQAEKLRIAGRAYALGHLSLRDVAVMLDLSQSDTVFELERTGCARSIETIQRAAGEITDDALGAIAAGIEARKVAPTADPERVRRDVVASQRIEGIDARRWV